MRKQEQEAMEIWLNTGSEAMEKHYDRSELQEQAEKVGQKSGIQLKDIEELTNELELAYSSGSELFTWNSETQLPDRYIRLLLDDKEHRKELQDSKVPWYRN